MEPERRNPFRSLIEFAEKAADEAAGVASEVASELRERASGVASGVATELRERASEVAHDLAKLGSEEALSDALAACCAPSAPYADEILYFGLASIPLARAFAAAASAWNLKIRWIDPDPEACQAFAASGAASPASVRCDALATCLSERPSGPRRILVCVDAAACSDPDFEALLCDQAAAGAPVVFIARLPQIHGTRFHRLADERLCLLEPKRAVVSLIPPAFVHLISPPSALGAAGFAR